MSILPSPIDPNHIGVNILYYDTDSDQTAWTRAGPGKSPPRAGWGTRSPSAYMVGSGESSTSYWWTDAPALSPPAWQRWTNLVK